MPFGFTHPPLVSLANSAITTFFRRIEVHGSENVPEHGPIIFACTHSNMAVDPAVLSNVIPSKYQLHYWVKDSLFRNPAVGALLRNSGNIAVDRKNKNNQLLFKGTFEALALDECIGVFPEGTSHTEPHMIPLKDGTSWAALEYIRYLHGTPENGGPKKGRRAVVVPVALCYTDKTHFRSRLVGNIGEPISMESFEEEFMSTEEGKSKLAVKRLTRIVELELWKHTVNAPDWDTAFAAQMARELLWEREDDLSLTNFVDASQTLVDLFATTSNERITHLKSLLVTYHRLLASSRLSNAALVDLPLPRSLDPNQTIPLPSRFFALWLFSRDTAVALLSLPFFLVPLFVHIPIYVVGVLGGRLVEEEMETQAQMKIAFGLILSLLTYPILFFVLWAVFKQVSLGAAIAAGAVWLIRRYHTALIDYNYDSLKRLVAAWRLLIGLWLPKRFEYNLPSFLSSSTLYAPDPPKVAGLPPQTPPEKYTRPQRLPSRVLVRHVLRIRAEAARELATVLLELEASDVQVPAAFWLAHRFGGQVDRTEEALAVEGGGEWPRGSRSGGEVVGFLRGCGARLGKRRGGKEGQGEEEEHWAAANSGNETEGPGGEGEEEEGDEE